NRATGPLVHLITKTRCVRNPGHSAGLPGLASQGTLSTPGPRRGYGPHNAAHDQESLETRACRIHARTRAVLRDADIVRESAIQHQSLGYGRRLARAGGPFDPSNRGRISLAWHSERTRPL